MRVMHIISGIGRAAGTSVFCVELCNELAACGHGIGLFTGTSDEGNALSPSAAVDHERRHTRRLGGRARLSVAPGAAHGIEALRARLQPAIAHVHAIWNDVAHAGVVCARRNRLPLVVSPHGMLTPWALNHHAWRKRLAWLLYQRADLRQAALLHAAAPAEAEDLRRLGFRQPIAVVPLGVKMPDAAAAPPDAGSPTRTRTVLFLARIHPIKGLPDLVEAWARLRPQGWRAMVVGPDENGHRAEVEALARRLGVADAFCFRGPLFGVARDACHGAADLFVLPSHSENFGVVVLEALAHGVPVIATRATPWEALERQRCGWWVDVGVAPLAAALRQAMALSDKERQAMGARGRQLVAQRYSWPAVAAQMAGVYAWLLGNGPRPPCVVE